MTLEYYRQALSFFIIVLRLAEEKEIADRENAEKQAKYEAMLSQMMMELSEETALLLYPWVFLDEEGNPRDKKNSPAYCELVNDLFEQCFDVVEETRIRLNEDMIKDMFVESGFQVTEDIMLGEVARGLSNVYQRQNLFPQVWRKESAWLCDSKAALRILTGQ